MSNVVVMLIIFIVLLALQIFLSLQKKRWYGLILPILYLIFAAFGSFGSMFYTGDIGPVLITFLVLSIPAGVNFIIYLACRSKVKEKNTSELEKMNIQDLN